MWSAWANSDGWLALAAALHGALVPFTLLVIRPVNNQLLDPALDPRSADATRLLNRWGRLHTVRTIAGAAAFVLFLLRLGGFR